MMKDPAASGFKKASFKTRDGGSIEGSFFEGMEERALVFAHGKAFNKESWYPLAERFQEEGYASLAIDFRGYGNSRAGESSEIYHDVLGAIDFLVKKGVGHIALIGGSMGGAAILDALSYISGPEVDKVILLSPAGGKAIRSRTIRKLFVVSEGEGFYAAVQSAYGLSAEPKVLKVYPGSSHAQHLLKSEHGRDLIDLMVRFLREK